MGRGQEEEGEEAGRRRSLFHIYRAPSWPWAFRGDRDQTALLPWSSPWGGGSVPVGITEEGLP